MHNLIAIALLAATALLTACPPEKSTSVTVAPSSPVPDATVSPTPIATLTPVPH